MKIYIILIVSILLSGCNTFYNKTGSIVTYNCQSNYVNYLKYDENEIFKFKKDNIKKAYIENGKDLFNICSSYPCQTCNKYLCKRHLIKEISFLENENIIKFKFKEKNRIFKKSKYKKIKNNEYKYSWSILSKKNEEYETLKNLKNGNIIYEIVTKKSKDGDLLNTCDVETYDIFNSFYFNY